jgi:hypothetical protein
MRRRRKVNNCCELTIYCGACESRCIVDVSRSSLEKERNQAQFDTFYICADCTREVEHLEREENLYYFQSHLVESVVNYSSHG